MIRIPTAAIKQYARDAGINEGFLVQHQDLLEAFALRVAAGQLKKDRQKVRAWYFDNAVTKPQLFELLDEV